MQLDPTTIVDSQIRDQANLCYAGWEKGAGFEDIAESLAELISAQCLYVMELFWINPNTQAGFNTLKGYEILGEHVLVQSLACFGGMGGGKYDGKSSTDPECVSSGKDVMGARNNIIGILSPKSKMTLYYNMVLLVFVVLGVLMFMIGLVMYLGMLGVRKK